MKVSAIVLLLSTLTSSAFALTIPIEARDLEERTYTPPQPRPHGNTVKQSANSGNYVESYNNGPVAYNEGTTAYGGKKAVAIPIAVAKGGNTNVNSGDASNSNMNKAGSGGNKVKQEANSGNTVISSGNGPLAYNEDTKAIAGGHHGTAIAIPVAYASGGNTNVNSGDASNSNINEKRTYTQPQPRPHGNTVKQSANSGNTVVSHDNGPVASNENTHADGYLVGVAVPIAVSNGGNTNTSSGKAKNSNTNKSGSGGNKTKQNANSGNTVYSYNNGPQAGNKDTSAQGGLVAVAVPVAVANGGNTNTNSGDASNENTNY